MSITSSQNKVTPKVLVWLLLVLIAPTFAWAQDDTTKSAEAEGETSDEHLDVETEKEATAVYCADKANEKTRLCKKYKKE